MNASAALPLAKTLTSALLGIALLHSAGSHAAVSQSPLRLTIGVPPNMLLTLDDSGSMRWGFAPDALRVDATTRRAKSSAYNPLYYNPETTYQAPIVFDTSGSEVQLSTTFSSAWHNGYRTGVGTTNLGGAGYRVAWDVPITTAPGSSNYNYGDVSNYAQPTGQVLRLADNPSEDFSAYSPGLGLISRQVTSPGGIRFTITPTLLGLLGCSAVASVPGVFSNVPATCSPGTLGFTASLSRSAVPAYYYVYDSSRAGNCTTGNDNCYALRFVTSAEQQNFANWYSFYRNRALATISAAALAFYDLSPSVRLSWQGLGRCTSFDGSDTTNCRNNAFKAYTPAHKGQLYAWLQNIAFDQSTFLPAAMKRAGEFYSTPTPWQAFPSNTGTNTTQNTYACRASYHIMMTDGQWNEAASAPGSFRHDATSFTLPDGRAFGRRAPYYDATANTLADLAMHYWATDLNGSLSNNLPAYIPFKSGDTTADYWNPRNDPATWQHMTNFTMGLGLTQSLARSNIPWSGSTFAGSGYTALAGGAAWPAAGPNEDDANVYDLWHAAINSRGEFFSVDSPEAMVQAFSNILSRIADRKSSAARPTVNSGQVNADGSAVRTVSYQTSFASDNWSGDVKRFETRLNTQTNSLETGEVWSAMNKVPAWSSRTIKIASSTAASGLQDFNTTNAALSLYAGSSLLLYVSRNPDTGLFNPLTSAIVSSRIDYLRGNRTGEGTTFRRRSGLLGDFYSSTPAVVAGPRYLEQFSNRLENNTAYTTFKNSVANRTPRIYVGGNAGMLHGFNARTGVEEFAFIPSAVFPKLYKLTGSNYSHEFYVEGSPVVGDVYDTSTRQWRTILVGTLKGGGKSVFALDVTNPGSEKLLWQFDENSITAANAVKMGYSFSQPTIARLHNGKWGVVFGNGYESAGNSNGKAALFVLDAMQGTLLKSLEVQGTSGIANGLSTPRLADYNADGVADYAYAGDLQGNMWRFDLLRGSRSSTAPFTTTDDSAAAASEFKVGFGGNPLFRAAANNSGTQRQPITAAPSLVAHPTGTGYLVIFGTGRFFDSDDKDGDKSMPQSVYGIWDKQTLGEVASNPNIARSSLQAQTITNTVSASSSDGSTRTARIISNNAVRWQGSGTQAQNGWYLNLVQSDGEMVVENMSQLGRTVFFQSLVPNSDPCGDGASNWSYAINPFTGGRTSQRAFDFSPTSNVGTSVISGVQQDGEGGGSLAHNPDGGYQFCTGQECVTIFPDPSSIGRQSWRRLEEQE